MSGKQPTEPFINFMIIGAQKSGTTALAHFLRQHPDIYLPEDKEVHLFDNEAKNFDFAAIEQYYRSRYAEVDQQRWVGDSTPIYLYWTGAIERIHAYNPRLKLIIVLRNPIERAISHYYMEKERGREKYGLFVALLLEPFRLWRDRNNASMSSSLRCHSYVSRGQYSKQLRRLYSLFPESNIHILSTHQLLQDHAGTLAGVLEFLGLNSDHDIEREIIFARTQQGPKHSIVRALLLVFFLPELFRLRNLVPFRVFDWLK